jgi:predicted nucleic acid-binding protein
MFSYMLDTDTCSYVTERFRQEVLKLLQEVRVSDMCISVITKSELLFGVEMSPRRQQDETALNAFLAHPHGPADARNNDWRE